MTSLPGDLGSALGEPCLVGGGGPRPGPTFLGAVSGRKGLLVKRSPISVQVEDAVLDTYDLVYDQAVKNVSGTPQQQLVAIQDTVSMWVSASAQSPLASQATNALWGEEGCTQPLILSL